MFDQFQRWFIIQKSMLRSEKEEIDGAEVR